MKTMTIANQNTVAAKAVKEEKIMNKNTRFVIAVVIGSICNMKQVNQFKKYLATIKKSNVDILVAGNPIRVQKLGRIVNEAKAPVRMIGCGVKNSNVFAYTHQDEHPCLWAINHADAVVTIGEGSVVTKAIDYAFKSSRSCYIYGKEFKDSICRGHYDKEIIMRADIVTTNEAKAIKAEETKPAAEPKVDPIAVAKAELDAAKKAYEAAQAKYDKLVAESKPMAKEEVVGRGRELFVDVELSSNMGDITKSFTEEQKKVEEEAVDEAVEAFMAKEESKPVEMRLELAEPVDGQTEAIVRLDENGLFVAEPVKADFTFEGKGYNVVVKEAFDVELFNSFDAETKKMVIEESAAAGHIVAA